MNKRRSSRMKKFIMIKSKIRKKEQMKEEIEKETE